MANRFYFLNDCPVISGIAWKEEDVKIKVENKKKNKSGSRRIQKRENMEKRL